LPERDIQALSQVIRGGIPDGSGERLNGIQEVSGSIPLISTNQTGKVRRYFGSEKWQKRKVSVTFSLF
jgi:hypothetical protein